MDDNAYRELVRCAALAASSHNTQPWQFRRDQTSISILPDFSRRCPAVDPDDHHLFVSLGCAAENLVNAAEAAGLRGSPMFDSSRDGGSIRIELEAAPPQRTPLYNAIAGRQCTRAEYDGRSVPIADLRRLEDAGSGSTCSVLLLTAPNEIETVAEYVAHGNAAQFADPQFVDELIAWVRFSRAEAERTGDGLSAAVSGHADVPRWFGKLFMRSRFSQSKRPPPVPSLPGGLACRAAPRTLSSDSATAPRCRGRCGAPSNSFSREWRILRQ